MALPQLPTHYHDEAYQFLVDTLPFKWFHQIESENSPLVPYLKGMAWAIAHLRYSTENATRASIPMLSEGVWLSLHLQGIGLQRRASESIEQARTRYQWEWKQTRNTRLGELAALEHFLGLTSPTVRLEADRQLLGQFRLVLDDEDLPWNEVDTSFIGTFIQKYVTNGIIPSVDISLQCLQMAQLPYFRHSDLFEMGPNQLKPFWDAPGFLDDLRLEFSRSLIAQVTAPEWRLERDRLLQLHSDSIGSGPGMVMVYLSDKNPCPYLRAEISIPDLADEALVTDYFEFDGFHHWHLFPRLALSASFSLDAPPLVVDVTSVIVSPSLSPVDVPNLVDIEDLSGLQTDLITLQYYGLSFTTRTITEFITIEEPTLSAPDLIAMSEGIWSLALTEGNPQWGNFPPSGTTREYEPFVVLQPSTFYWSDSEGDRRSPLPFFDDNGNVYLAIEFLYPKATPRTIREIELRLTNDNYSGGIPHYRRVAFPLDEQVNAGFLFLVTGLRS